MFSTVLGDIIATIEQVGLNGQSLKQIDELLKSLMAGNSAGQFQCQVFKENIFRFAHSSYDVALLLITSKIPVELTLTVAKRRKGVVQTSILRLWNPDTKEFVPNHVVIRVSPDIADLTNGKPIYFGDILTQINGRDADVMSESEVQHHLSSSLCVHVTIVEFSLLRRKDLFEAGLESERESLELKLEKLPALS